MKELKTMKMQPALALLAMRRQKWETRRPFKGGTPYLAKDIFIIESEGPQLAGFRPVIKILEVRKEELQWSFDLAAALAEGFPNIQAFAKAWDSIYSNYPEFHWEKNPLVWVVRFELLKVLGPEKERGV